MAGFVYQAPPASDSCLAVEKEASFKQNVIEIRAPAGRKRYRTYVRRVDPYVIDDRLEMNHS